MKRIATILISGVLAMGSILPANAFPMINTPAVAPAPSQIETVQWHGHHGGHHWRPHGGYRGGWHGGYRGYRGYRGGYYHHHHGWGGGGALLGGLAAGAIIGGALAQPRYVGPRYYRGGNSHQSWCYARYRSYRAYDNTYQPYGGPRRQCVSP